MKRAMMKDAETIFQIGDKVTGNVQGMEADRVYTIADMGILRMPFGDYVTYYLEDGANGERIPIANGHLLLTLVKRDDDPAISHAKGTLAELIGQLERAQERHAQPARLQQAIDSLKDASFQLYKATR